MELDTSRISSSSAVEFTPLPSESPRPLFHAEFRPENHNSLRFPAQGGSQGRSGGCWEGDAARIPVFGMEGGAAVSAEQFPPALGSLGTSPTSSPARLDPLGIDLSQQKSQIPRGHQPSSGGRPGCSTGRADKGKDLQEIPLPSARRSPGRDKDGASSHGGLGGHSPQPQAVP